MGFVTINGRSVPIKGAKTVLEIARREGIWIPTLCNHPGLPPYGACRLCLVEVKAGAKPGLAASCTLPATDGLVVETDTPRVQRTRKILIKLLLERAPEAEVVKDLAKKLGVVPPAEQVAAPETTRCILCGLCVRACESIGSSAIGFAFRGSRRKVMPPFGKPALECLGCQACVQVCPTGEVVFTISGNRLQGEPWRSEVELKECASCGRLFAPRPLVEHLKERFGFDFAGEELCPECRRQAMAAKLAETILPGAQG
ncbi:MAG: 2Fe-2S iron-sulfur cluster domain with dehydrogenase [Thermoanaerobacterales bacterium 50_218]|nr:MAG: 2Fe-2S iron-sulfur cluster domain with dehydrogenase [Thermoanaerobacterales bacterium 50_218]HAA90525.1 ferredoxin [Peptococcaceae bacterium]